MKDESVSLISHMEGRRSTSRVAGAPHSAELQCQTSYQTCPIIFNFNICVTLSCVLAVSQTKLAFSAKLILLLHVRQTLDGLLCTSRCSIELQRGASTVHIFCVSTAHSLPAAACPSIQTTVAVKKRSSLNINEPMLRSSLPRSRRLVFNLAKSDTGHCLCFQNVCFVHVEVGIYGIAECTGIPLRLLQATSFFGLCNQCRANPVQP